MDAQSGAEELLSSILAASTPQLIASAVSSTIAYLRAHPLRPFFSLAFPALLSRLLFPSPSSPPWLLLPEPLLPSLLHPSSPLLSALLRHSMLLRYSFPLDRLPLWLPLALPHAPSLPHPLLLHTRAVPDPPQLLLSPFDYFIFWFAYHPLSNPSPSSSSSSSSSIHRPWNPWRRRGSPKHARPLYPRLLLAYLRAFVPLRVTPEAALQRAEFVVNVFVHFWLVGNDFSPLPLRAWESLGTRLRLPRKVSAEVPPASGLGEVLEVLVKYVNSGLIGPAEEGGRVELGVTAGNLAWLWNSTIQRPLYRFVLRTLLFHPVGESIKNVGQVLKLWMVYLEPWRIRLDEFDELELLGEKSGDGGSKEEEKGKEISGSEVGYSSLWSDYVASNYPFYSSLVVHFLGFAHKFVHIDAEMVVQMTLKLVCILASSRQLLDLLKEIDATYQSKSPGSSSVVFNSSYKHVPSIREQLQDWEDGLCESEADGSFLHERRNRELKLFSESEDGAHHLFQVLILRAETELRAISSDNEAASFQNLESLRSQMNTLFGGSMRRSPSSAVPNASRQLRARDDIFTPNRPGIGKQKWTGVGYQGDWMKRPTSDSEVAWLARHLVKLSDRMNELLGLNRNSSDEHQGPTYLDMPSIDFETEFSAKEVICKLLGLFRNFLMVLAQAALKFMRSHGWRINLRLLASKKIVAALFVYILVNIVRKCL